VSDIKLGDKIHYNTNNVVFFGYLIGGFQKKDGTKFFVGQGDHDNVFFGKADNFKSGWDYTPKNGEVIIRDRSDEPASRILPPTAQSKPEQQD
jgi:hypothetical protein